MSVRPGPSAKFLALGGLVSDSLVLAGVLSAHGWLVGLGIGFAFASNLYVLTRSE